VNTPARWIVAVIAALLIVALLAWARGDVHHHGDDIGAMSTVQR